jgi:hypothetical protein
MQWRFWRFLAGSTTIFTHFVTQISVNENHEVDNYWTLFLNENHEGLRTLDLVFKRKSSQLPEQLVPHHWYTSCSNNFVHSSFTPLLYGLWNIIPCSPTKLLLYFYYYMDYGTFRRTSTHCIGPWPSSMEATIKAYFHVLITNVSVMTD